MKIYMKEQLTSKTRLKELLKQFNEEESQQVENTLIEISKHNELKRLISAPVREMVNTNLVHKKGQYYN